MLGLSVVSGRVVTVLDSTEFIPGSTYLSEGSCS